MGQKTEESRENYTLWSFTWIECGTRACGSSRLTGEVSPVGGGAVNCADSEAA